MLNLTTGEDEEEPTGGMIGAQVGAPVIPMPPPPSQAPGPMAASPMPAPPPSAAALPPPQIPGAGPPVIPNVEPYSPQMPAPVPVSRVVTPAESANLAAIDKNTAARVDTAHDRGDVNAVGADAHRQEAERRQFVDDAMRQEQQRIADEASKRIQERQAQANADYAQFKAFGIKDPEASDNFGTRILKAIAIGMGQYASGINGGGNTALQIIQQANKDNIDRQKAEQEKLFRQAEKSGKDVDLARRDRDDSLKQLDLKHSALLESSAGMLRAQLGRLGVPQAQIDANHEIQKLENEALQTREKTLAGIRDDETALAKADIAAAARRAKASAAAGGVRTAALAEFAKQAGALQPGEQIPPDLMVLGAKAGYKPNQIATEANKLRSSGANSQGAADKADETAYKTYVAPHVRRSDELNRRVRALNSAEAGALNPKSSYGEVIAALESGIAADAGAGVRGVSMGQLHSIIPNLVSAEGKISNLVSNNWDGTAGEEFRKATLRFIQRAKKERMEESRENGAMVEKELAATPYGQRNKDFAKRGRERLYPESTSGEGGRKSLATHKLSQGQSAALIDFVQKNPNDPRTADAKERLRADGYQVP